MLLLKSLLLTAGFGLFAAAAAVLLYDAYRWWTRYRAPEAEKSEAPKVHCRWAGKVFAAGWIPLLIGFSIIVIPSGMAGVRVSQIWGARPGTLYPGVHLVTPLVDTIAIYDTREQVYATLATENPKQKGDVLTVQVREGLNIGLAVSVRYRLEPKRLDSIHTHLPQPVGEQVVAPVVATIYRQLAPNFITREIFATRREELRSKAAELITSRLASEGIVVREVLLRHSRRPAA